MRYPTFTVIKLATTGLVKASCYRLFSRGYSMLTLPPVAKHKAIREKDADRLGQRLARIINLLLFWNPGPCFLRAYTVLYVLRHLGIQVDLNFGIVDPFGRRKKTMGAHCWLSRGDNLFLEDALVREKYPQLLATDGHGLLYWTTAGTLNPDKADG